MNGISSLKVNEGACVNYFYVCVCVCVRVCVCVCVWVNFSCLDPTCVWRRDDERVLGLFEGETLLSERRGRPELLSPPPQSHSHQEHTEKH